MRSRNPRPGAQRSPRSGPNPLRSATPFDSPGCFRAGSHQGAWEGRVVAVSQKGSHVAPPDEDARGGGDRDRPLVVVLLDGGHMRALCAAPQA